MRIVFYGTPPFAAATLRRLLNSAHEVVAVVTQPDRPRGRGRRVLPSAVKELAAAERLHVLQPERVADHTFRTELDACPHDLAVVAAYGRLLPEWLLGACRSGTINVHASLLPKWRGAAPVHRAIMAGETETGVTIIRLVKEMDAGPMLAQRARAIDPAETSDVVEADLAVIGADLLLETVDRIDTGTVVAEEQDHALATFAPRLTREDGVIDWRRPAQAIHDQVRGLHPWPHASAVMEGRRYLIHRTDVVSPSADGPTPAPAGTVVDAHAGRLVVRAGGDDAVAIRELQPEGRSRLSARAFLAGHHWRPGVRFNLPHSAGVSSPGRARG